MRNTTVFVSALLLATSVLAVDNADKLAELKDYKEGSLKSLVTKSGNIGKEAKALDDAISAAETFCRGTRSDKQPRINMNDCTAMLDKALKSKSGLEQHRTVLEQSELQSATGGAAAASGSESKVKPTTTWQKGHTSSTPANTSNTVGAPKMQAKQMPTMGKKKPVKPAPADQKPSN